MSTSIPKNEPVHIGPNDGDAQFVLHADDNDLFVRTGRQIIEASRLTISISVWLDELKQMFELVRTWCEKRTDKVRACVAVGRGSKVMLFFIPVGAQFHFDLADELSELNREIVTSFNIGMVEVGQIPATEIDRFLNRDSARTIYGSIDTTPRSVET